MASTASSGTVDQRNSGVSSAGVQDWPKPRSAWYAVGMISFISVLSNIDRGIISLLVEPIKRDLQVSDTEMGLLIGFAFSFFYMIVGLPMSRVTDVRNRRNILTVGLSIWSMATALSALAYSYLTLFIARGIVGAGESVKGPTSMSMISDIVPRSKLPRAMSIYSMGIAGGMAASMIIGGVLLELVKDITPIHVPGFGLLRDWQFVFLSCGMPGLLVALVFFFTVKEPTRKGRKVKGSVPLPEVARFVWSNKRVYVPLLLSLAIGAIESFGMSAWRVAFFERTHGWTPNQVGPLLGFAALLTTPIGLVIGTLIAERLDRQKIPDAMIRLCLYSNFITVPAAIAMPLMPTPWLSLGLIILSGVGNAIGSPGQNSAIQIITPNEMRGQLSAIYLFTISVVGAGLGPLFVALITDFVFVDESMLRYAMLATTAVLGPLGLLLTWLAMRPYGEAVTRVLKDEAEQARR
ncbi:MFS family permease [Sphingobium sp. B11D3B]|uniref:MFS transporter n=1 Tax=Sphingobium sp. B11D3B TaxID=2940575 RepID=UPI0022280331|nr:MFS transporter [Sphingobium sp. B11D3B]MCW2389227.1 MFS family permease [Sphingobium sp. B11D3B]